MRFLRNELLGLLNVQAERLLMVLPGSYEFSGADYVSKQVRDLYEFDCRNPEVTPRSRRLREQLIYWLEAYEYVRSMDPKDNDPDPSMLGVIRINVASGVTTLVVHCFDHDHFKTLPAVVTYGNKCFGKVGWNSDLKIGFFRTNAPIAIGAC